MPGSVFLNTAIVSRARCSLAGSQPAMAAPTVPTARHATTRVEMSFRIVTLLRHYREAIMVCRMATGVLAGGQQPLEDMRGPQPTTTGAWRAYPTRTGTGLRPLKLQFSCVTFTPCGRALLM